MQKSPSAFRTISEVGEVLGVPAHVLRFWESKFTQIKPVKRGGGRRYYRPDDVALIRSIQHLLHEQGMTIKGAQKILREQGVKATVAKGHELMTEPSASRPVIEDKTPTETSANPSVKAIFSKLLDLRKSIETQIAELG